MLVEAIAAGIGPLEFRRKVGSEMRFNFVVHDPVALFNIIDQQRRDQRVIGPKMLHAGKGLRSVTLDR